MLVQDRGTASLDQYFRRVARAPGRALLLDYDGTLAPFTEDRARAVPYPGVRRALNDLISAGRRSRLTVVSGRPCDELPALLGLDREPEIWGSHGWERRPPGGPSRLQPIPAESAAALTEALRRAERRGLAGHCERKPAGLAMHWRGSDPDRVREIRSFAQAERAEPARRGVLELRPFDGGLELRVPGRNKADAVRTVLDEAGPDAAAAYLGDDRTDEDAFEAIRGRGLSVLVRPERRETRADVWLRPPEELLEFLRRWTEAVR